MAYVDRVEDFDAEYDATALAMGLDMASREMQFVKAAEFERFAAKEKATADLAAKHGLASGVRFRSLRASVALAIASRIRAAIGDCRTSA